MHDDNEPDFQIEHIESELELGQYYPLQLLDFLNQLSPQLQAAIHDALWLRKVTQFSEKWEWVEAGSLLGADLREWEIYHHVVQWDKASWDTIPLAATLRTESIDYGEEGLFLYDEYGKKINSEPLFFREHLLIIHIGLEEYMKRRQDADFWNGSN